jgi:hypothetical protein
MRIRSTTLTMFIGWAVMFAISAYAGSGNKRAAERCAEDNECSRGHCYAKQDGDKVCVDCSPSEINDYRGQVQRFCKVEPRGCNDIPKTEEASEEYFKTRIENGERCVTARDRENRSCWNGGDEGHRTAVDEAEKAKRNCYDELNTRRGNGGIYTCSDSTYATRAAEADASCGAYGRACEEWSKDDKVVDCGQVEDAMKKTARCVEGVERLDSDCLPSLSKRREAQFGRAKNAYDVCKGILEYKKDKKLCK